MWTSIRVKNSLVPSLSEVLTPSWASPPRAPTKLSQERLEKNPLVFLVGGWEQVAIVKSTWTLCCLYQRLTLKGDDSTRALSDLAEDRQSQLSCLQKGGGEKGPEVLW